MIAWTLYTMAALAGVPEPGIMLYGQVTDARSGEVMTSGHLVWTYISADGTQTATVSVPLRNFDTIGGTMSYAVSIPLEDSAEGFDDLTNRILVRNSPQLFTRSASVNGMPVALLNDAQHLVALSLADRGARRRVDLLYDASGVAAVHSADRNEDYFIDLWEMNQAANLFEATGDHAYHCDTSPTNGYSAGFGPHTCFPHSGDYLGGADWRLDLVEFTRLIELHASPNGYCNDENSEDGFRPGSCAAPSAAFSTSSPNLQMTRRVVGRQSTALGIALDVQVRIRLQGGAMPSVVGLHETLPAGWYYQGVVSGPTAITRPGVAAGNELEFAWLMHGPVETTFGYRALVSNHASLFRAIHGHSVHRSSAATGATIRVVNAAVGPIHDLDGDGYDDQNEGGFNLRDTDADGLPDFIDTDSDNDGVSDAWEREQGTDPFDATSLPALPLTWALYMLAAVLFAFGAVRPWMRRSAKG